MVADVRTRFDDVLLELPVDRRVHLVDEDAVDVAGEELVPPATPDHLDDVPARAPERRFELLDDLAVAAHRAVEALQVAVDDEDQVVEVLARRDREPCGRLGLVHLAVADEAPDLRRARVDDLVVMEVAVEPRLRDGVQRTEAHRHRRELPELREAARVRVAREPAAEHLPPEPVEVLLGESPLEVGAGVDPRGRVALDEHLVAEAAIGLAAPEVVEPDVVERGRRREGREVASEAREAVVGAVDHRHGVPADAGADPSLETLVGREPRFRVGRDRVHVVGRHHRGHVDAGVARALHQPREEVPRSRRGRVHRRRHRANRATPASRPDRCRAAGARSRRGTSMPGYAPTSGSLPALR